MKMHPGSKLAIASRASIVGRKEPGGVNQDAARFRVSETGNIIAAVGDGVGSLPDSHLFSAVATQAVLESLAEVEEILRGHEEASEVDLVTVENHFHATIRERVRNALLGLDGRDGATTLLYAVLHGKRLYWSMVGDGAIAILPRDGGKAFMEQMEGREFGYTDVVEPRNMTSPGWCTGWDLIDAVSMIVLMTDGVSDAMEDDPTVFLRFLDDQLAGLSSAAGSARLKNLLQHFPEAHGDDKSLVTIRIASRDIITDEPPSGAGPRGGEL